MLYSFLFVGFLLGLLTVVYLAFELKNSRDKHRREKREYDRKLFELSLLGEISDKIGYSLSTEDIASTIASTAIKLLPVTSVTYAIVDGDHTELITFAHESIGPKHIDATKNTMLNAMFEVEPTLKSNTISHKTTGPTTLESDAADIPPASYFNVPLMLNNRFTGMITVTSKQTNAYIEEDMSIFYKIVNRAQFALGRLENVVEEEKSKIDALVKSLSSGEMFFTLKYDSLKLFTINPPALRFLNITEANPDIFQVLSKFTLKPNVISEMKDVVAQKKSTIYRDVLIGDLRFNIYLTPVFTLTNDRVIGVALTMQDMTREHEAQKMREGFTNMMVHELRAPLTAIKGASDLLLKPGTDDEDRAKMRLIIKNSAERLLSDVDDMLDSARIDAGKVLVHKQVGDLNQLIAKTVEVLTYMAQGRSILIETHLGSDIPKFAFDSVRITQVITNLISNAIKYSDPHTVISIYSRVNQGNAEVEVKDHGIGIEEGKINDLFKPFAQGNFAHKAKGTGLGLYVTKTIIDEHSGKIWVNSKAGVGSSFIFSLPLDPGEPEKKVEPKATMAN